MVGFRNNPPAVAAVAWALLVFSAICWKKKPTNVGEIFRRMWKSFFFPTVGNLLHDIGLRPGDDFNVGLHGLIVRVAGPFHDHSLQNECNLQRRQAPTRLPERPGERKPTTKIITIQHSHAGT